MAKAKEDEQVAAPAPKAAVKLKRYYVSLKNCAVGTQEIEAVNPEEAWEKYKELGGIIRSKNQPQIVEIAG